MENKKSKDYLYKKIYGCLLGGVIGDAMGAPSEGMKYTEIAEKFGYIEDFEGEGTDDSAVKQILCEAILEHGGYITADEFAESFLRNNDKYGRLFYVPVHNMVYKVMSGLTLPVYAGFGNMQSSSSAMAISPMGIINAFDPKQAAIETYDVAGLLHAGDTTFCRDGACAIAAAVAEALKPEADVESVLKASVTYLHKTSSKVMIEAISGTLALCREAGSYEAFRKVFYKTSLREVISDSRETVPCALALFYLAGGDARVAIPYGANFGRDADTIATMVGALCGAFMGIDGMEERWVQKADCTKSSSEILSAQQTLAEKLEGVVCARLEEKERQAARYKCK